MSKLPVDINATYDDSDADASIALHQQHHDVIHAAINNQVSKGDLVFNLRDQPGVVGDGITDDAVSLQAALDVSAMLGARAFANGKFRTTRTLRISSSADLSDATILYYGTEAAIEVGAAGTSSSRKSVRLPHVVAASKTRSGWAQVAGTVGVRVQNSYNLDLTVPYIKNFETGLVIFGDGNGTSYCNITLGHLDNNMRNLRFTASSSGWANQNNFYGGRFSHNSNEGVQVVGTRHILIDPTASPVNANSFWGTSIESPNVVEYHLDCAGNDNYFVNCRWENTGSGARVIWRKGSAGNVINYGFGSQGIVETMESGTANVLLTRAHSRWSGDGGGPEGRALLSLENTSSSSRPVVRVLGAGAQQSRADQNSAWAMEMSAFRLRGKRPTDAHERVSLDNVNGRLYFGDGTDAPQGYLGVFGKSLGIEGSLSFVTDNTHDLGTSSRRPRYVRAATGVQTGAFTRSARPTAKTAGIGTCIFDTTLRKPIWSTGTTWVDATGKAV